jgi:DNA polymerase elongation subunit (family B)
LIYLDIETIPQDPEPWAPSPKPPSGWKDPEKIAAWLAEHADDTRDETSLQALWGGIVVCVGIARDDHPVTVLRAQTLDEAGERVLLRQLAKGLDAYPRDPIVTWNGAGFDLPFIYRRAMILGVSPKNFGAPPLTAWTKRYDNDKHIDMMTVWAGTNKLADADNLADVAMALLGETRAAEEYEKFPELMQTQEGRDHISAACLHHTELTYRIFERAQGCLFA